MAEPPARKATVPANIYRHTHKTSRLANILYNTSLLSLVFLIIIVLLAAGYDVAQQIIVPSRGQIRFGDTATAAGGYVFVALISACIAFSRYHTVRKVLASIPKGYVPLGKDELNKNLYRLVASEYTRCAMIVNATQPTGRHLPGWGDPGTDYADIHFRTAILQTFQVLEAVLPRPTLNNDKQPNPTRSIRASPMAKYLHLITCEPPFFPKSVLPLLQLYEKQLEDARWKLDEPTQEDYETCLRIVAVLVDVISKRTANMSEAHSSKELAQADARVFGSG